jgi:hypothetical protein
VYLRLGKREIGLGFVLGIIGGLSVIAVIITAAVIIGGRSVDSRSEIEEIPAVTGRFDWIDPTDLVVEDELARGTEIRWLPFRPRRERWTEADAQEHWIDPRQIGIDVLEAQVNDDIRLMLEDVR